MACGEQTGARDERVCVDCAFRVGVVPRAHDTIRLRSGSGSGSGFRAGCHRRCRHCTASVQENGCSSSIPACVCARSPKEGRCPVDGRACGHTSGSPGLILILILIPTWPLIPFTTATRDTVSDLDASSTSKPPKTPLRVRLSEARPSRRGLWQSRTRHACRGTQLELEREL